MTNIMTNVVMIRKSKIGFSARKLDELIVMDKIIKKLQQIIK